MVEGLVGPLFFDSTINFGINGFVLYRCFSVVLSDFFRSPHLHLSPPNFPISIGKAHGDVLSRLIKDNKKIDESLPMLSLKYII